RGFSFGAVLGARGESGEWLGSSSRYESIVNAIESDVREVTARPAVGGARLPNHPFDVTWLRSPDTHFELIGVMNRLDRTFADPKHCGELRLIYRLTWRAKAQIGTRLPLTVNVMFPQAKVHGGCQEVALRWVNLPASGRARVDGLSNLISAAGDF